MRSCLRWTFLLFALFAQSASGIGAEHGGAAPLGDPSAARPISELPPHVRFTEGETSLFIDYSAEKDGLVPAYHVNASDFAGLFVRRITFVLREIQAKDGTWYRCEPPPHPPNQNELTPEDSVSIPPDFFYQTTCRLNSARGEKRKIRFIIRYPNGSRAYPSNPGLAIVDPEEAFAALSDFIATYRNWFNIDELAAVALGTIPLPKKLSEVRMQAIGLIGSINYEPRRLAILKKIFAESKRQGDPETYRWVMRGLSLPDDMREEEAEAIAALACDPCKPRAIAIWQAMLADIPRRAQPRWTGQAFWKLLTNEMSSRNLLLARVAMENIGRAQVPLAQKMSFLEKIISNPKHPLLREAINVYAFVGKPSAVTAVTETLQAVLQSPAYPKAVKTTTGEALGTIQP